MPLSRSVDSTADDLHMFRWFLWAAAIIAIIGGIAAILAPFVATVAANYTVGVILVTVGILQGVGAFGARRWSRAAGAALMGLLAVVAGVIAMLFPLAGILALTTVLTVYLFASGALKLWFAGRLRPARGTGWMVAGGIASVALAILLLIGFPANAFWVPGLFLGIDLLVYGAGLAGLLLGLGRPHGAAAHEGDAAG